MPFTLPDHVEVSPSTLRAIAKRHRLPSDQIVRQSDTGIFNAVYRISDQAVLRIPRNHPKFVAAAQAESVVVPAVRQAGVETPALLAFDEACDLLPGPYTVYELVQGVTLESCDVDPDAATEALRAVGRDLAKTHVGVAIEGQIAQLPKMILGDPRRHLRDRVEQGWLSSLDARWIGAWLERLAPSALTPSTVRFLHGDTQATNIMVDADALRYHAIIDWGSAALGDVACDFAGVPLRAVPHLLAGHREIAEPDGADSIEARIVWRHLELALMILPRGAVPGRSWAERPLPMLLEALRFFMDTPDERWRAVGPMSTSTVPGSGR